VFAKELMERHAIATARFRAFTRALDARRYAWELGAPLVVKADGLAAGKGAIVCETLDDADRAIALCLEGGFGEAGRAIVVEEFLSGQEVSFFVLSDGSAIRPLAAAQDHKAVFDGDRGPNTGGMGAYSPAPVFDGAMEERVIAEIVRPVIAALSKEGSPYQGVLFVQLMISDAGPRVVEFNCRFGDPECEAIVPRLAGDLLPLLHAVASGRGLPDAPAWRTESSVAVVLASGGYPGSYRTGLPITGIDAAEALDGVTVFQAGTALDGGRLVTAGGRVMAVQALAPDVRGAIDRAYAAAGLISFPGMHYRRDIGRRATCA
jgi:phosphoribosylamine--glycine ligase